MTESSGVDVSAVLAGRVPLEIGGDDLVSDAVVVLRVVDSDGQPSTVIGATEGTDGVVQIGLLVTAADITRNSWMRGDGDAL